jgi:hypothetical protein
MSIHSTGLGDDEPLAVSPKRAGLLLDKGQTSIYAAINAGELEAYKDGASTKITMRSIRAYIQRRLERSQAAA